MAAKQQALVYIRRQNSSKIQQNIVYVGWIPNKLL
ncbi:hypothetical protein SLEP1_g45847 [Rubroshorea leprosula]|uniref:Uncharacterized protein n=1 Tax=Rubroshorea leprosula TaxID=152421 RepID=A0AAV5LL56_9ROSI|nr:hypothetical protein SLEP1_g45847 [Rubroshorea leprosula]